MNITGNFSRGWSVNENLRIHEDLAKEVMNKPTHKITMLNGAIVEVFLNSNDQWETGRGIIVKHWFGIHSLTPIETEEKVEESETFDWKQAMKLFADGVELQHCVGKPNGVWTWHPSPEGSGNVQFYSGHTYRRKPVEPLIEKSYQGIDQVGTRYLIHTTLESAKKNYPHALAYLELTYKDGKPVEARVIGKDTQC